MASSAAPIRHRRRDARRWCIHRFVTGLLASLAASAAAQALDVLRLESGYADGAYRVQFEAVLAASPRRVLEVLESYADYPQLDPRIIEARIVGAVDGHPLLYTRLHGCLGSIFCRDMRRVEKVIELADGLVAEAIPERSDVSSGRTETKVFADGTRTRLRYESRFEPSFWMPDMLVRGAMRRTLEQATRDMFTNVEARARSAP